MVVSALVTYVGSVVALQLSGWPLPELTAVYPVDWLVAAAVTAWLSVVASPAVGGCTALFAYLCCSARTEASRAGKARMATSLLLTASVWQAAAGTAVLVLGTDFLTTAQDSIAWASLALALPLVAGAAVWPLAVFRLDPTPSGKANEAVGSCCGRVCAVGATASLVSVVVAALLTLQVALVHLSGSSGPGLEQALELSQPALELVKQLAGSAMGERDTEL